MVQFKAVTQGFDLNGFSLYRTLDSIGGFTDF